MCLIKSLESLFNNELLHITIQLLPHKTGEEPKKNHNECYSLFSKNKSLEALNDVLIELDVRPVPCERSS